MSGGNEPDWFLRWRKVAMFVIGAAVFIAAAVNAILTDHFNGQLMLGALTLMGVSAFLPGVGDSNGKRK